MAAVMKVFIIRSLTNNLYWGHEGDQFAFVPDLNHAISYVEKKLAVDDLRHASKHMEDGDALIITPCYLKD